MNLEVDPKKVGLRIRDIRKRLGLSMTAFAERIDQFETEKKTKSGTVSNWETGKNLPNNNRLKIIAELGEISVDKLLYGSKEEYTNNLVRQVFNEVRNSHSRYNLPEDKTNELIELAINKLVNAPIAKNIDYIESSYAQAMLFDVFNTYYENTVFSNENAINLVTYNMIELSDTLDDYFFDRTIEDDDSMTTKLKDGLSEELYNKLTEITDNAINTLNVLRNEYPQNQNLL